MLRAILGICGVALIALGVFGGSVLENTHQAVNNFFVPDTVVARGVEQPQEQTTAAIAVAGTEPQETVTSEPVVLATTVSADKNAIDVAENLTEVKASAKTESELLDAEIVSAKATIVDEGAALLPKQAEVSEIIATTTGSVTPSTLFVMKERVNLREGPSISHPIVLQLDIGQELMEFKRDGKWVHVGAYGTAGKIGWVHGTLVGKN